MGSFASRGGLFLNAPLKQASNAASCMQQDSAQKQLDIPARIVSCNSVELPDMDNSGTNSNIQKEKADEANAESS